MTQNIRGHDAKGHTLALEGEGVADQQDVLRSLASHRQLWEDWPVVDISGGRNQYHMCGAVD